MAEKQLVRKRVRLEKNHSTQSFYKYLHSQSSTTSTGAGYIRKEGRKKAQKKGEKPEK
jgi:hypothetical protein